MIELSLATFFYEFDNSSSSFVSSYDFLAHKNNKTLLHTIAHYLSIRKRDFFFVEFLCVMLRVCSFLTHVFVIFFSVFCEKSKRADRMKSIKYASYLHERTFTLSIGSIDRFPFCGASIGDFSKIKEIILKINSN